MRTIARLEPRVIPKFSQGTAVMDIGNFVDFNNKPVDPTTITYEYAQQGRPKIVLPYGSSPIIRNIVGEYTFTIDTTSLVGLITCVWIGTGDCEATNPAYFIVEALPI